MGVPALAEPPMLRDSSFTGDFTGQVCVDGIVGAIGFRPHSYVGVWDLCARFVFNEEFPGCYIILNFIIFSCFPSTFVQGQDLHMQLLLCQLS